MRSTNMTKFCFFLIDLTISGILPEVSVDPMKVVQDAVLEFTDKKDLFLAYMSSMLVGGPGEEKKYEEMIAPLTQLL